MITRSIKIRNRIIEFIGRAVRNIAVSIPLLEYAVMIIFRSTFGIISN